ncbi:MAG: LysR family transcriptional regulator [Pseudomonadota bacterium]
MDIAVSLRILANVARHSSFAGAARDQTVSTSTVMRAMDELERRVGVTLLARSTRRVELTEAGHRLLSGGAPLVDALDALIQELQKSDSEVSGHLRITTALSFGRTLFAGILRDFLDCNAGIAIDLVSNDSVIDLDQSRVDVAIRIADPVQAPDLIAHELSPMHRCVCASPTYVAHYGRPEHPDDLQQHSCLLFRPMLPRDPWAPVSDTWTFAQGGKDAGTIRVRGKMSGNDADALVSAAREGLGIVMMPDWLIADDVSEGRLIRLLADFEVSQRPGPKSLHIAYPQHRRHSRKVQAFVSHVQRHFKATADVSRA